MMVKTKIPEGWEEKEISELIIDVADGGTPSRTNPEYFGGDINWVVIEDIKPVIKETKEHLTEKGLLNSNAKLWPKGAIILSTGATIGEVGIALNPTATKQGICGLIAKEDKVFNKYLMYLFVFHKDILLRYAQGTSFREIRPPTLKKLLFCISKSLPEQQKISKILSTIDNAIDKTKELIEKNKKIKQGLMHDLFLEIMRNNDTISFSDKKFVILVTKGTTPTTYGFSFVDEGINFIKVESISENGNFIREKFQYIDDMANAYLKRSQLKENDILFSIAGALGRCALVTTDILPANINQALAIIRFKEGLNVKYVKYILDSFIVQNWVKESNVQLAQANLSLTNLRAIRIPFPKQKEQERIANILSSIDNKIQSEENYLNKLVQMKAGLMQALLSGDKRVSMEAS